MGARRGANSERFAQPTTAAAARTCMLALTASKMANDAARLTCGLARTASQIAARSLCCAQTNYRGEQGENQ